MKRTRLIQLIVACLVMIWSANPHFSEAQYIHGDLTPGSYHVGFKVYHEYDASRTFKASIADDGTLTSEPAPRPMQIAVWYPAQGDEGNSYMNYRDYYFLDATVEDPEVDVSDEMKHTLVENFTNQTIFTGPADASKIGAFLELGTQAIQDATPIEGEFPLIIYSPREYRGVYYNTQLIEYLVSHGFIVATTPNKDNQSATVQSAPTTEILAVNTDDLRYVKGFMTKFPNVDPSRIGVMGWAWGAVSAIALAESDPNVSAVVSLDGNVRFAGQRPILENLPGYSTESLSTPILHLESGGGQLNGADYTFYDQIKYADAYHVTFKDAQWYSPSTYFYLVHAKGSANPDQFNFEQLDHAHNAMIVYVKQFLAAYLGNDQHAKSWLDTDVSHQGFAEDLVQMRSKKGLTLPPTASLFSNLFMSKGARVALQVWDRVKRESPDYQIAAPADLNNLGYGLMWQGRMADAIEAFKLQVEAYPHLPNAWDSMGECYKNNGDDELAIQAFEKSLSLNPPEFVKTNSITLLEQLGVDYKAPAPYPLSSKEAEKLVGTYTYTLNGQTINTAITWESDNLKAVTDGQPELMLVPQSKDTFWAMQNEQAVGMTLEFNLEKRGVSKTIKVTTPQGQSVTATRKTDLENAE